MKSGATSLFDVGRSMFDVGRSSFFNYRVLFWLHSKSLSYAVSDSEFFDFPPSQGKSNKNFLSVFSVPRAQRVVNYIKPDFMINKIASDEIIDEAYEWLCNRRKDYHPNNDIWHLRFHWNDIKPSLQNSLLEGTYGFEPVRRVWTPDGFIYLWASQDALVLKAVALVLNQERRPHLSTNCYHLTGKGGGKGAVRAVQAEVSNAKFVFKSDVKKYYASMDHHVLMGLVNSLVSDRKVRALIRGYMGHLVDEDGELRAVRKGIRFGCPLSPVMGALYLKPLDEAIEKEAVFYARYMDDWIVLADTRWKLRGAVKAANEALDQLKVQKHPFKTFIGRIIHGFDFLGYRLTPESAVGLDVAWQTIINHFDKIARLYEQGAGMERIGQYVKGWWQWVNAGVDVIVQSVEELWKRKWDGLHGGIKFYMTSRNSGVNSKADAARAITEVSAAGPRLLVGSVSIK
jgi:RNA-directed DNA polymerase